MSRDDQGSGLGNAMAIFVIGLLLLAVIALGVAHYYGKSHKPSQTKVVVARPSPSAGWQHEATEALIRGPSTNVDAVAKTNAAVVVFGKKAEVIKPTASKGSMVKTGSTVAVVSADRNKFRDQLAKKLEEERQKQ